MTISRESKEPDESRESLESAESPDEFREVILCDSYAESGVQKLGPWAQAHENKFKTLTKIVENQWKTMNIGQDRCGRGQGVQKTRSPQKTNSEKSI